MTNPSDRARRMVDAYGQACVKASEAWAEGDPEARAVLLAYIAELEGVVRDIAGDPFAEDRCRYCDLGQYHVANSIKRPGMMFHFAATEDHSPDCEHRRAIELMGKP